LVEIPLVDVLKGQSMGVNCRVEDCVVGWRNDRWIVVKMAVGCRAEDFVSS
jgi:hypothetical protein